MTLSDAANQPSSDTAPHREVTFRELPGRTKLWIFGVPVVVAAIAVLASNSHTINAAFSTPTPDVSLEDVAVFDDGYAPRVDMIVLNKGDARALVTGAHIEILDELRVPEGNVSATAGNAVVHHDVTITAGDDEKTSASVYDFGRQVAPLDADRIALTIATRDAGPPTLLACKVQVVLTCVGGTKLETQPLILPGPQFAGMLNLLEADVPPDLASEIPTLHEWVNDPAAMKGPALKNLTTRLGRHLETE